MTTNHVENTTDSNVYHTWYRTGTGAEHRSLSNKYTCNNVWDTTYVSLCLKEISYFTKTMKQKNNSPIETWQKASWLSLFDSSLRQWQFI